MKQSDAMGKARDANEKKRSNTTKLLCMILTGIMLFQTIDINVWAADSKAEELYPVMENRLPDEETDSDRLSEQETTDDATQLSKESAESETSEAVTNTSQECFENEETQENTQEEATESTEAETGSTESDSAEPVETETAQELMQDEMAQLLNDSGNIAGDEIDESYGHIIWAIDKNGKLTVSGNGDYAPCKGCNPPWYPYAEQITSAEVNVKGITSTTSMFHNCRNMTSVKLSGLDTSNVTQMNNMFYGCSSLSSLDVSRFNTTNVTSMFLMFGQCEQLTSLDVSHFNTANVTNMGAMFNACTRLSSLDVSHFNTKNVENMEYMFCWTALTDLDVSNFDTGSVTNMSYMFSCCTALTDLTLGNFDTGNVTRMEHMFANCGSLKRLNVDSFRTANVENMGRMFSGCADLTELDVSRFNTKNVKNMCSMFAYCYSLESLDLSSFDMSNALMTVDEYDATSRMIDMFQNCNSLKLLKTPTNCSVTVNLPTVQDTDRWFTEDSALMETLPNTSGSVTLHKGRSDILVTQQPQSCEGTYDNSFHFTVDAEGENLSYRWQVSEDKGRTWHDLSSTFLGYDQKQLEINALEAADGYEYRCRIWNDMDSKTSDAAKLSIHNSGNITITGQPTDYIGDELGTANFSVTAKGNGLTYRWQVSEAAGTAWEELSYATTGFNQEDLQITFLRQKEGFRYRCVITDKNKEIAVSDAAKIMFGFPNSIKIISQPTYQRESSNSVRFEIEAEGEGLVYQWQVSKDKGLTWTDLSYSTPGFNEAVMKITVIELEKEYQYRCELKDKYDNSKISEIAVLAGVKITSQPTYKKESVNSVKYEIKAEGKELTYQWEVSTDGGVTWNKMSNLDAGVRDAAMTITINEFEKGYQYRCIVTDKYGNSVTSDAAVQGGIIITSQPTYKKEALGSVCFEIKVKGEGLIYRWQISTDGGTTWNDVSELTEGFNKAVMRIPYNEFEKGYQYRCKITDQYDNDVVSDVAVQGGVTITGQPVFYQSSSGVVVFEIEAEGEGLRYQWQVSTDGGATWTDLTISTAGYNRATMKLSLTEFEKGYQYRCKVTDRYGTSVTSKTAVPGKETIKAEKIFIRTPKTTMIMGTTVKMSVEVEPNQAWTDSSNMIYTSSDTDIAEIIERSGKECMVLAKAPGKVTITAALEGTMLTAVCELTVKGIFHDDLRDELFHEIGTLYFFEGIDRTLADIKLPDNWSWTASSSLPQADDSLPVQLFQAVYTQEGYEPYYVRIPVNVIRLNNVEIVGNSTVQGDEENGYYYLCHYTGSKPPCDTVTQQWSLGQNTELVEGTALDREINIKASHDDRLSLKVRITNPTTQAAGELSASLAVRVSTIKVVPSKEQPANAVRDYGMSGAAVSIDAATQYDKKEHFRLALNAPGAAGAIHWTSSDTSVMTVDQNGMVNIKTAGVATITATTDTAWGELLIRVADNTPVLDHTSVTVNMYAANAVPIGLIPQNGNAITGVTIEGAKNGTLTAFDLDGVWCIKASGYQNGGKEKVSLTVHTKNGIYKDIALDVFVEVSRPDKNTVRIKQTVKPNLFYCGREAMDAEFVVSSTKFDITNIYSSNNNDPYIVKSYNPATGKLVLTPSDSSKSSMQRYHNNMPITLTVETAELSETVAIPLNVGTQNKKPKLRLEDAVFVAGVKSSSVKLCNGTKAVDTAGIAFKVIKAPANDTIAISASNGMAKIFLNGNKNGSYTAELSKSTWTSNLTVYGKVTKVSAKRLTLEASAPKLTINTRKEYHEPTEISVFIKGNHSMMVADLKAKPLKKDITATVKGSRIIITAKENATGTVKLELTGKVNDTELKKAVVTITLTNKTPDITFAAKGSINIADRANTFIEYTPTVKNLSKSCSIENVMLVSATTEGDGTNYKDCFEAVFRDGKMKLSAVSGRKLRPNVKYTLKFDAVFDNSTVVSRTVTVRLKNTLPKVTVKAVSKNLYKTNPEHTAVYQVLAGREDCISRVNLIKANAKDRNTEYFDVQYEGGKIFISFKNDGRKQKAGNYNLVCEVIMKDADNSKPIRVSLKIAVK